MIQLNLKILCNIYKNKKKYESESLQKKFDGKSMANTMAVRLIKKKKKKKKKEKKLGHGKIVRDSIFH